MLRFSALSHFLLLVSGLFDLDVEVEASLTAEVVHELLGGVLPMDEGLVSVGVVLERHLSCTLPAYGRTGFAWSVAGLSYCYGGEKCSPGEGVQVMTGVELIVAALVAGAAAGAKKTADALIGDLYQGLKTLVTRKLADRREAVAAVEADRTEPRVLRSAIEPALVESGADTDRVILEKAQELLDQSQGSAGKFVITNHNPQGVQMGDHGNQINHSH
ncbi:hypothetical protein GCM10009853_100610 [Glycomyces scopariae]